MTGTLFHLFAAVGGFVALHTLVAGTPLRGVLIGKIGENAYKGLFSLASLGLIVWAAQAYNDAYLGSDPIIFWDLGIGAKHATSLLMLIAIAFAVLGLSQRVATSMTGGGIQAEGEPATGIMRVTRHPLMCGIALWGLAHLLANGDAASALLFGGMAYLALRGPRDIDARLARQDPEGWVRLSAVTSHLPFAAIVGGRNRLVLREIAIWRWALVIVVYLGLFGGHQALFGVSPV